MKPDSLPAFKYTMDTAEIKYIGVRMKYKQSTLYERFNNKAGALPTLFV